LFCGGFLFFDDGVLCFGFGMVWRLVSVCKFHFFAFLVCKIGGNGAVVVVSGGL
jgi:hypothetical protein